VSKKKSHKEAHYVRRSPYPKEYCGNCSMFQVSKKDGRCTLVVDPIEYAGWCAYYEPKDKERKAA
jgi:hypothetical protein